MMWAGNVNGICVIEHIGNVLSEIYGLIRNMKELFGCKDMYIPPKESIVGQSGTVDGSRGVGRNRTIQGV